MAGGPPRERWVPIHLTKVLRYAYQREVRFAFLPNTFQERLDPQLLGIGPTSNIADFVPLRDDEHRDD